MVATNWIPTVGTVVEEGLTPTARTLVRWSDRWLHRTRAVAGVVALVSVPAWLVVAIAGLSMFEVAVVEGCADPCTGMQREAARQGAVVPAAIVATILTITGLLCIFLLVVWSALLRQHGRARRWKERTRETLYAAKGWYARDEVPAEEFETYTKRVSDAYAPLSPVARCDLLASVLFPMGVACAILGLPFALFTWNVAISLASGFDVGYQLAFSAPGLLVCLVAAATFLPAGAGLRAQSLRLGVAAVAEIDAAEEALLDALRTRHGGTPRRRPEEKAPVFKPFGPRS